ncbi:PREDICTED: E3 ubiquitin-protein ligase RNF25 [Elephantulus edwardii]|uniref:E3 ubiquitin-protein ligase RNF25 n=1 Tax=Elephantulus edwardii TaxID=28737 RepID=UPI0003F0D907|nr:PREDICTED: E3 ubiquitin-protein ligase RNF25 [Elephantulus edwardii]
MAAAAGPAGEEYWVLPSEIEVLESIYLDELQVVKGNERSSWEIYITLHPATAEDQDSQYVCFTLVLQVPAEYPNEVPQISIRNPRGLSDEQIHTITQTLSHVAKASLGTAMLYELIEKGKEILTDNNIPHGHCVICLYGFQEKEAFTKTPCYHYFHCHCLARYIQHMEQELKAQEQEEERQHATTRQEAVGVQCPVCREPLVYDLATLEAAPEPQQPMELYQPDAESLRQQEERKRLYQRQQERGGIIDLEAERNRFFISLQQTPAPLEPESAVDVSGGSHPPGALTTELSTSSAAQPTLSTLLPVASQHTKEKTAGAGPNQKLGKKTMPDPSRARRDPWRLPKQQHPKGGESCAPKSTNCAQELPPPEGPCKESCALKSTSCSQELPPPEGPFKNPLNKGVQGSPQEKGPGTRQGPQPRRTRDCARWERSRGRTPGSSYPRLPRGRGVYRPGGRREHLGLEPEDGS